MDLWQSGKYKDQIKVITWTFDDHSMPNATDVEMTFELAASLNATLKSEVVHQDENENEESEAGHHHEGGEGGGRELRREEDEEEQKKALDESANSGNGPKDANKDTILFP